MPKGAWKEGTYAKSCSARPFLSVLQRFHKGVELSFAVSQIDAHRFASLLSLSLSPLAWLVKRIDLPIWAPIWASPSNKDLSLNQIGVRT